MNVSDVMTRNVATCHVGAHMNSAARLMWESDCGAVAVVDDEGRAIAMITDRDICMAALLQGRPLDQIPIWTAASDDLHSVSDGDSTQTAALLMRTYRVRRLPVLDAERRLVGIVALSDLLRPMEAEAKTDVLDTLAHICNVGSARAEA